MHVSILFVNVLLIHRRIKPFSSCYRNDGGLARITNSSKEIRIYNVFNFILVEVWAMGFK